jgi:3-methyladenine DNA glycosylase AlkC
MRKKIEFLDRMFKLLNNRFEILDFLKQEKIITDDTMQNLLNQHHSSHPSLIVSLLDELAQTEKLQLLNYEWTILPKELLQLTIVTEQTKKQFTYVV